MKVIAHRGDVKHHPENTLSAFQAALDAGADAVELDVHMTHDGVLVVHHDYYLGRPDNGKGKIHEKDFTYIQNLTIGESEHIPTLEEVFQQFGNRLQYEIELKGFGEQCLQKAIALVKEHNLMRYVEFTSPHSYTLTRLKEVSKEAKVGKFTAQIPEWMDLQLGQTLAISNGVLGHVDVLHLPIGLIDKQFVQDAHNEGLLVHAADCDTNEALQLAQEAKTDQLSTNELELAIAYFKVQ